MSTRSASRSNAHELALVFLRDPKRAWYGNQLVRETGLDASRVSNLLTLWIRKGWATEAEPDFTSEVLIPLLRDEPKRRWRRLTPLGIQELSALVKQYEQDTPSSRRSRSTGRQRRLLDLEVSRPLRRVASVMMVNPHRTWTTNQLSTVTGVNALPLMTKFFDHGMAEYTGYSRSPHPVIRSESLIRLTPKGRKVLGTVVEWLSEARMDDFQYMQCRDLARELISALPEELADRMILNRGNVIHLITDNGQTYVLTITPR